MLRLALMLSTMVLFNCLNAQAFQRVECMDRPDGSVYIFKSVVDQPASLDVRIYHGWQYGEHQLPGLPIGIEKDFLNIRYPTRTAEARKQAIASFTPLERLIFDMDIVFHHRFKDCDVSNIKMGCRAGGPIKIGRVWISDLEFFFDAHEKPNSKAQIVVYTVGLRGHSTHTGLKFSSGRRYSRHGTVSQCLYLKQGK